MTNPTLARQARMRGYLAAYQAAHHASTRIEYRDGFYYVGGAKRQPRFTASEIDAMTWKLRQLVRHPVHA